VRDSRHNEANRTSRRRVHIAHYRLSLRRHALLHRLVNHAVDISAAELYRRALTRYLAPLERVPMEQRRADTAVSQPSRRLARFRRHFFNKTSVGPLQRRAPASPFNVVDSMRYTLLISIIVNSTTARRAYNAKRYRANRRRLHVGTSYLSAHLPFSRA